MLCSCCPLVAVQIHEDNVVYIHGLQNHSVINTKKASVYSFVTKETLSWPL